MRDPRCPFHVRLDRTYHRPLEVRLASSPAARWRRVYLGRWRETLTLDADGNVATFEEMRPRGAALRPEDVLRTRHGFGAVG